MYIEKAMATTSLLATLKSHVDIPFNASLSLILVLTYRCLVSAPGLLLAVVMAVSATIGLFDRVSTRGEMIKTVAELPLGLGSVLLFIVASHSTKAQWLHAFTAYVNVAVYGNIAMMVATPAGDTYRGLFCRVACLALSAWIVLQGRSVGWRTVMLHDDLFVFTAASRSWVIAHAVYRAVLLTLPAFGSGRRHRLLEVYSLGLTFLLSRTSGLPFEYCFGMADTTVAPAATAWSSISKTFRLVPYDTAKYPPRPASGSVGDVLLSGVLVAVAGFACVEMSRLV
ncbi:hypothetical protein NLU13_5057 [Sarocladium strictum]|uniref:Uncharacterized protein n=1 Tax=Sarocladium strictum TaxID=5046 RepID=A0AA39GKV9_SARSR|nr:hypothetical protein NLU13_5057 [Sarocladium strictum]